jgi:FtsP/CotA-like multicopper oxidase with cupredoxin domain
VEKRRKRPAIAQNGRPSGVDSAARRKCGSARAKNGKSKKTGANGSITVRIRFKEWTGKDVFHCHVLDHEDTGMMRNFLIR